VATLTQQLGLNHSIVERYWAWLVAAVQGNLGHSLLTQQPVGTLIATRAPVTAELGLFAILIALAFSIPVAVLSARRPGGIFDRVFTFVSILSISIPQFVLALGLLLIFALKLGWFPTTGFVPISQGLGPNLRSLVLPAVSLALFYFSLYLRVLRGDMVQQLGTEHYVETARGKGMGERRVLLRHVFPNALFGMITVVTVNLGLLIGGSVLIEQIFEIPGMGNALVQAINTHDAPVVQGVVVCLAIAIVLANLLADVLYMVLDPRVRISHGK
jgi:peptide/nickel transport system permease protein